MHATESQIPALLAWLLVIQGIANFTAHLRYSPTQDLLGHKSILHNSQATAVRANDDAAFFSLYLNKNRGGYWAVDELLLLQNSWQTIIFRLLLMFLKLRGKRPIQTNVPWLKNN